MRLISRKLPLGLVLFMVTLAACSTAGGGNGGPRRSPTLITAEELAGVDELHAMGAIQRLRPNWLRPRGAPTPAALGDRLPALRIDGVPRSRLEDLVSIQLSEVAEIRFLGPTDATMMYGTGFPNGVIELRTH